MIDVNLITANVKKQTVEDAMLVAYAVIASLGLNADELSKKEAYKMYGKKWIDDRTRRGLLKCSRCGEKKNSTIVYSKFDIEALKRAEKGISDAYNDALRITNNHKK